MQTHRKIFTMEESIQFSKKEGKIPGKIIKKESKINTKSSIFVKS